MIWSLAILAVFTGLIIGSFLNVVIHRGPTLWKLVDDDSRRGDLSFPRSYCPACHKPIRRAHLIPVFSYLALRGKCADCAAPVSMRYPIVEILGAAAGLTALFLFGATTTALFAAVFFWFLIALACIDFETGFLPDALTFPLIGFGLIANAFGQFTILTDSGIGAVVGYGAFRLIAVAFEKLRGVEGLGQGDAKLLAATGAWLGWQALAPAIFIAALSALGIVLIMHLSGKKMTAQTSIPFGPALCTAATIMMLAKVIDLPPGALSI